MATQSEMDDLKQRINEANDNMLLARGEIARVAEKLEAVTQLKVQMLALVGGDGTGGSVGRIHKEVAQLRTKVLLAQGAVTLLMILVGWLLVVLHELKP